MNYVPSTISDAASILPIHDIGLLAFYVICLVYISLTIVLYYHWSQYSVDLKITTITFVLYGLTTIPLILALGGIAAQS
jgi:hypothetical protein